MLSTLYKGSVKDVLGPAQFEFDGKSVAGVVFQYTDAYSVFDWGRMPDILIDKGAALAVLAADWFQKLESPEAWAEYSRTPGALAIRKAASSLPVTSGSFAGVFNEMGERLQREGLRTHFLGALDANSLSPRPISLVDRPFRHLAVRQVSVVKPVPVNLLGRTVLDYGPTRAAPLPRLIPLEVVFRFSCPPGSSFTERAKRNPDYWQTLPLPRPKGQDPAIEPGVRWEFPVLEFFTKLEPSDRPVSLNEALMISGVPPEALQEVVLKTAWIAGFLKDLCAKQGLELADGKLEWGLTADGRCLLVDAIGPDELRILKNGVQLSKEFLRSYYRDTPWYESVKLAKAQAEERGISDWKRLVTVPPPALPAEATELGSQLYRALANALTGKSWFKNAWPLHQLLERLAGAVPAGRQ